MLDGLKQFLLRGGFHALVKLRMKFSVELKKIQSVHAEPLVRESGDEVARFAAGNHSIDLLDQYLRGLQLSVSSEFQQRLIRRSAPEKVGKSTSHIQRCRRMRILFVPSF